MGVLLLYRDGRLLGAEIAALGAAAFVQVVVLLAGLGLISRCAVLAQDVFDMNVSQRRDLLRPGLFGHRGCLWRDASFLRRRRMSLSDRGCLRSR